ncbi:hypothetical protein MHZ36_09410 [Staphylococcus sp. ACRSN]|uniref:hypothetical protein n=1 Tax=Staphylococcus sp. ACRSN TaxID=2918214 RepID=UPI001EF2B332|nr:hypothetical protein [Staphylococcus sp. ACRSN]MCG7339509.1 hypothetical protein [Staphylococcus sp. ACRSN]
MNTKTELDKGFFISTILNILFLIGLTFIFQTGNLFLLIAYVILMVINAIYLVVKTSKNWKSKNDI